LYRRLVNGPRAASKGISPVTDSDGDLVGPFKSFLVSPELGSILEELGSHLRFSSPFEPVEKELAILRVAQHMRSQFEWDAHVEVARGFGATESQIESVADLSLEPQSDLVRNVDEVFGQQTHELRLSGNLSDTQRMYLISLVGYYALIANLMHEFGA
jgi:AhpD family alkylhydroperoxidase